MSFAAISFLFARIHILVTLDVGVEPRLLLHVTVCTIHKPPCNFEVLGDTFFAELHLATSFNGCGFVSISDS